MTIRLRPARATDGRAVAEVWLAAFDAALPTVTRAHDDAEVRAHFAAVAARDGCWVAEADGQVVAMMVLAGGELEQLYVDPRWQGQGIGGRLLDLAERRSPSGLALWTFQVNTRARAFYARHGFVEVELTDGSANEEHEPDVRMTWRP